MRLFSYHDKSNKKSIGAMKCETVIPKFLWISKPKSELAHTKCIFQFEATYAK